MIKHSKKQQRSRDLIGDIHVLSFRASVLISEKDRDKNSMERERMDDELDDARAKLADLCAEFLVANCDMRIKR
jgi:hypothetical protein